MTELFPSDLEELILINPSSSDEPLHIYQLDLFNWGTFDGRHIIPFHQKGTAVIGVSGSGKSSVCDAIMTVLVQSPQYNLASTGGLDNDRNLMSYIRGFYKNLESGGSGILREGATITGVSVSFRNSEEIVRLTGLFSVTTSGQSAADKSDYWIYSVGGTETLDDWLTLLHTQGARGLKKAIKDSHYSQTFTSKRDFSAYVRRLFNVSEKAFALYNRAMGLKQIGSIDDVFRTLVLDERPFFEKAGKVVSDFDGLKLIKGKIDDAENLKNKLLPIVQESAVFEGHSKNLSNYHLLSEILPRFFAQKNHEALTAVKGEKEKEKSELDSRLEREQEKERTLGEIKEAADTAYKSLGGGSVETLKELIEVKRKALISTESRYRDYLKLVDALSLEKAFSEKTLRANQEAACKGKAESEGARDLKNLEMGKLSGLKAQLEDKAEDLKAEIEKIERRPNSNVPNNFQDFRRDLAIHLKVSDEDLPFLAELIEVKKEDIPWRGAIERALGGSRLKILLEPSLLKTALAWVKNRDNRLHVRLLDVSQIKAKRSPFSDGFVQKLNFKTHPFQEHARGAISEIDRHCVSSADDLIKTSFAMTIEGLMSQSDGYYEKADDKHLLKNLMTGFSNKDLLASLKEEHKELHKEISGLLKPIQVLSEAVAHLSQNALQFASLGGISFEEIDFPSEEKRLQDKVNEYEILTKKGSTIAEALAKAEEAKKAYDGQRKAVNEVSTDVGILGRLLLDISRQLNDLLGRFTESAIEPHLALLAPYLKEIKGLPPHLFADKERAAMASLVAKTKVCSESLKDSTERLTRRMMSAKEASKGLLDNVGSKIPDVPHYIECYENLVREALPDLLERFSKYLNEASDQSVTQLVYDMENEIAIIVKSIEGINKTLKVMDFEPGVYIKLITKVLKHEITRELDAALRTLRSISLQNGDLNAQFKALQTVINILDKAVQAKTTLWSKGLLDPRYRIAFSAARIDRKTDSVLSEMSGSASGSGGEKEILTNYLLTASLCYAFTNGGQNPLRFGNIILDEAFSKTSEARASGIIEAAKSFGFSPIFITPNKELGLLKDNTSLAIYIRMINSRSSFHELSWEVFSERFEPKYSPAPALIDAGV